MYRTPLLLASWLGHSQIVVSLLRSGADPNIPEDIFIISFFNCIFYANVFIVFHFDSFYFTPLHRAAIRGYAEVIQQLLKGGADPNAVDYEIFFQPVLFMAF